MRIGVMSDTHNHLANVARIVELLNAARVERVVHTGDITQAKTLHALAGIDYIDTRLQPLLRMIRATAIIPTAHERIRDEIATAITKARAPLPACRPSPL